MIQIAAQVRILVAVEAIDGRKYAPSTNMRSRAVLPVQIAACEASERRITGLRFGSEHRQQLVRRPEATAP